MGKEKTVQQEENLEKEVKDQEEAVAEATEPTEEEVKEGEQKEEKEEVSEVDKLKAELAEQKDKYLRMYSEFENFRRRTAKEKLELIKTANEELVLQLLPVIDDFERADKSFNEETDIKSFKEGIDLIYQKFVKAMESKGVKKVEVSAGDEFDDEYHEAITRIPAPEEKLKGKIVDVVESGYSLGDKVIRFAKVVTGE